MKKWNKVKELFDEALRAQAEDPKEWVESRADDPEVRRQVLVMLEGHERTDHPLDRGVDFFLSELTPLPDDAIGKRVGPYQILREIGRGGMGVVYQARDLRLERYAALKFLPASLQQDPKSRSRFQAEAQAASALDHPNICTVFDFGEAPDGGLYLAMAYYEGKTLRQLLETGAMEVSRAIQIAEQVLEGLKAAHRRGIYHRDIKPANILVLEAGEVKLLDFGVAKLAMKEARTDPGTRVGTFAYMSPEQLNADAVDGRADLWSLGVVLYEMLTGTHPFEAEQVQQAITGILSRDPPPLRELRPDVSPRLEEIVTKCLEKNAEDRFQSAEEILEALDSEESLQPRKGRGEIPLSLSTFVGRREEIQALKRILQQSRLVTLTGPAGTGKTRLALRLAEESEEAFRDGLYFVPLETVRNPRLVLPTLAQRLGIVEVPGEKIDAVLKRMLGSRQVLLILDNFEQVVSAGGEVARLLETCPEVRAVVTSRVALRVSGEHEFHVSPLQLPGSEADLDLDQLETFPSLLLFRDRAQSVNPAFEVTSQNIREISEICRRLDGLPLAIELAAARTKLLSCRAILDRLEGRLDTLRGGRDVPSRQQTLRQAIDWSYELLSPPERVLFRRLSVFAGGFDLEAAEQVCGATLEDLEALLDHSLVRSHSGGERYRFSMLVTIQSYAAEKLVESKDEEGVRAGHASYFEKLAREASGQLTGPEQGFWLSRLEQEHDNLRGALDWSEKNGESKSGLSLASSLWRFWLARGHLVEGKKRLERVLEISGKEDLERAEALHGLAILANNEGDNRTARKALEEGLGIRAKHGDRAGLAADLNNLGWIASEVSDFHTAVEKSREALELNESLGTAGSRAGSQ